MLVRSTQRGRYWTWEALVELSEHFVDAEAFAGVVCHRFAKFLEIVGIFDLFQDRGAGKVGDGDALELCELAARVQRPVHSCTLSFCSLFLRFTALNTENSRPWVAGKVRMKGKDYLMVTAPTDQSAEIRRRWLELVPGTFAVEQTPDPVR